MAYCSPFTLYVLFYFYFNIGHWTFILYLSSVYRLLFSGFQPKIGSITPSYPDFKPIRRLWWYRISLRSTKEKGPVFWTRPFFRFNFVDVLFGNYVDGTWAFFALTDIVRYRLAFLKVSVSTHLNLRMMDEQFFAAFIGDNESKTFFAIKPLYFTCSHCNSFGPCEPLTKILPLNVN